MRSKVIATMMGVALFAAGCGSSRAVPAVPVPAQTLPAPVQPQQPVRAACSVPEYQLPEGSKMYQVYFHCGDSEKPIALPRITKEQPTPALALAELLKGPTAEEKQAGFTSWFSTQTEEKLKSVTVDGNGKAVVDFANFAQIIPNASTSAGSGILKRELGYTLAQFSDIKEIEYRFDGSCNTFGEWQQSGCTVIPASSYK